MKKLMIVAMAITLASALSASAAERPYGPAGCGLGSAVFGKKDHQVLAATTNGTFASQLFGITFGTSNCVDDGAVKTAKAMPLYIEANRVALANDVARGNGETVANLSQVMVCQDSGYLATTLQKNYRSIFPTQNVESAQISHSIVQVVKKDQQLSKSCRNVI